jgi:glycosyltransferase involved in cell wall biosynthesis
MNASTLVSVGLPVRNGERTVTQAAQSVLAQDHTNLELIICDNASTDGTEEVCRALAAADERVRYHRRPVDIGLVPNFIGVLALAKGTWFRWIGDSDHMDTTYLSRCLELADDDAQLILISTQIGYEMPDDRLVAGDYRGTALASADPSIRFAEMLRLLTSGFTDLDPLYSLIRRDRLAQLPYRHMLRGDEVYAARIALAGPWGHLPEVLARRGWEPAKPVRIARRLSLPRWQAPIASELQCFELLKVIDDVELTAEQRRRARAAVGRLYQTRKVNAVDRARRRIPRALSEAAKRFSSRAS